MIKFASLRYDIVDEMLRGDPTVLSTNYKNAEGLIKESHIPSINSQRELEDFDVALVLKTKDGILKKYAHNDRNLSELNTLTLAKNAATLPTEIVKVAGYFLKLASKRWGFDFPTELDKIIGEFVPTTNVVEVDSVNQFAFSGKLANLKKVVEAPVFALPSSSKYPIRSAEELTKAASYFDSYYKEMPLGDRLEFSINLKKQATTLGTNVVGEFQKYAELNPGAFNPRFKQEISDRVDFALSKDLEKVAELYGKTFLKHKEFGTIKTASIVHQLDLASGIDKYYDSTVRDPILAVIKVEPKANVVEFIDGAAVSTTKIAGLAKEGLLDDIVSSETKGILEKTASVAFIESLPLPIRKKIIGML